MEKLEDRYKVSSFVSLKEKEAYRNGKRSLLLRFLFFSPWILRSSEKRKFKQKSRSIAWVRILRATGCIQTESNNQRSGITSERDSLESVEKGSKSFFLPRTLHTFLSKSLKIEWYFAECSNVDSFSWDNTCKMFYCRYIFLKKKGNKLKIHWSNAVWGWNVIMSVLNLDSIIGGIHVWNLVF